MKINLIDKGLKLEDGLEDPKFLIDAIPQVPAQCKSLQVWQGREAIRSVLPWNFSLTAYLVAAFVKVSTLTSRLWNRPQCQL